MNIEEGELKTKPRILVHAIWDWLGVLGRKGSWMILVVRNIFLIGWVFVEGEENLMYVRWFLCGFWMD